MATIKHISDGINTWDLPSGEAFKIPLLGTLSDILNGGTFTISGIKTADLKTAIANGQPIAFVVKSTGNPQHTNEILITNLGSTGGSGLALTDGTIAVTNSGTLKIMRVVFSGGATNVTSVGIWDNTPGAGIITLDSLSDVDIYQAVDGDVLTYDGNTNSWVNKPSGGGGSGEQLPVIIDIGRIIHQNGQPQNTIADVPHNNYIIPFDRQVVFSYRTYEQGSTYAKYWTVMPDAYKLALENGGTIMSNYEDLHWIVQDMINNQQLPLTQDIEYRLMLYKAINYQTYCIEIPLWLATGTTADQIVFYLDSSGFNVRQVAYVGADS